MPTTLDSEFLRTIVIVTGFRAGDMDRCKAALLLIGLQQETFSAADLPAEVVNGDIHLGGCATGALIAMKLAEVVDHIKSPHANAKGRKLSLLRIPPNRRETAKTWLRQRGFHLNTEAQLSLAAI